MFEEAGRKGHAKIVETDSLLELVDEAGNVIRSRIFNRSSPASRQRAHEDLVREARSQGYVVDPPRGRIH